MEVEKERAVVRYRRLRRAVTLCRWLFEGLALLALLSWSSDRLPTALAVCTTLLRRLAAVLFHPASAFVLGNLIVVTLFAKSGDLAAEVDPVSPLPPSPSPCGDALDHPCYHSYFSAPPPPRLYRCFPLLRTRSSDLPIAAVAKMRPGEKLFRRSETDVGARRRVTERWRPEEAVGEAAEAEDGRRKLAAAEDDNEEFRQRIETFISKQLRFIEREEESLLLAANGATGTGSGAVALVVAAGGPEYHRR
ncbi:hypothetical protein Taro_048089 [Colocasia esculenta]|uniref:DUF4408 domain-containing protein n=1 Tax=Colocasia esculenta TaxID=4460 RepID=A0A843X650_COLES|nr:hypothetical protein [Colocasia esculenta]